MPICVCVRLCSLSDGCMATPWGGGGGEQSLLL